MSTLCRYAYLLIFNRFYIVLCESIVRVGKLASFMYLQRQRCIYHVSIEIPDLYNIFGSVLRIRFGCCSFRNEVL